MQENETMVPETPEERKIREDEALAVAIRIDARKRAMGR